MDEFLISIEKIKPIIDLLISLIPLVITILGSYIALQQYRTNRMKLKNELFDKRYKVFECMNNYIIRVIKGQGIDANQRAEYLS